LNLQLRRPSLQIGQQFPGDHPKLNSVTTSYATLYRFGVTPEMYAEEYRRKVQLGELELRQDYSKTLPFEAKA
jgi:hypothetical protein